MEAAELKLTEQLSAAHRPARTFTKSAMTQESPMKAIVNCGYGPLDDVRKLQDIDKPVVRGDEVLV
jgi:hypothetical protein